MTKFMVQTNKPIWKVQKPYPLPCRQPNLNLVFTGIRPLCRCRCDLFLFTIVYCFGFSLETLLHLMSTCLLALLSRRRRLCSTVRNGGVRRAGSGVTTRHVWRRWQLQIFVFFCSLDLECVDPSGFRSHWLVWINNQYLLQGPCWFVYYRITSRSWIWRVRVWLVQPQRLRLRLREFADAGDCGF